MDHDWSAEHRLGALMSSQLAETVLGAPVHGETPCSFLSAHTMEQRLH
jgi:hypothetical protein